MTRALRPLLPVLLALMSVCGVRALAQGGEPQRMPAQDAPALNAPVQKPLSAERPDAAATDTAVVHMKPVVAGIAIFGNHVTRTEVILREMTLHTGDVIDSEAVEYCQSRIYSLGLFNRVSITWPPLDSTTLLVEVDERWYFYPVPMLGIVDRDLAHWFYGLGVTHQNFRGRNEKVFAGFVLGYNPWVALSYSNPWVFGESELFTESVLDYHKIANKSRIALGGGRSFDQSLYTISQLIGKRFDAFRSAWVAVGFNYLHVTDFLPGRTASNDGTDRFLSISAGARHDTRDLREYATQGIFGSASLVQSGVGFGPVGFTRGSVDLRLYQKLFGGPTLALRGMTAITGGPSVPNYSHVFFGYSERIRGHFEQLVEGDNIAGLWAELRIPIVSSWYLRVPEVPVMQFATWRFGLYAALFFDAGTTWSRYAHPVWSSAPHGYGAGIHLLLPYSFVARCDRAWDETGRGEWVFDIGASF